LSGRRQSILGLAAVLLRNGETATLHMPDP